MRSFTPGRVAMPADSLYDPPRHLGGEPDIRERLAREGATSLSDAELLAALLGTGSRGKGVLVLAEEVLELGRRLFGNREIRVSSPREVWPLVAHWADRKQERFICCSLNGAHELIAARVVSVGLVNRTVVHPLFSKS
jgi:DNA repair protein RadC